MLTQQYYGRVNTCNWNRAILSVGMASFSGALKLSDLDDFITPSQVSSFFFFFFSFCLF